MLTFGNPTFCVVPKIVLGSKELLPSFFEIENLIGKNLYLVQIVVSVKAQPISRSIPRIFSLSETFCWHP